MPRWRVFSAFGAVVARDGPPSLQTLVSMLLRVRLELVLAGIDGSGKTTLCSALLEGDNPRPPAPTIGLVVQRLRHRGINLMLWDLGGHHRFRDDWCRHARGCGALLFVVDCSDPARLPEARQALQRLIEDPIVGTLPLLVYCPQGTEHVCRDVAIRERHPPPSMSLLRFPLLTRLANKVDLLSPADRASEEVRGWPALAEELNLDCMGGQQEWSLLGISAVRLTNLDKVLRWLVLQAHGAGDRPSADGGGAASGSGAEGPGLGTRLWDWVSTPGKRRGWGGRYTSVLADASRSLLVSEA